MNLYTAIYKRVFDRGDGDKFQESLVVIIPAKSRNDAEGFANGGLAITLGYKLNHVKFLHGIEGLAEGAVIGVCNYQHDLGAKAQVEIL